MSDQPLSKPSARVCIAISTLGARAGSIMLPPAAEGLSYLILIQGAATAPFPERRDVTCALLDSTGLSHSRNAALDQCDAPYLLVSDDDLTLEPSGIGALRACGDGSPCRCLIR